MCTRRSDNVIFIQVKQDTDCLYAQYVLHHMKLSFVNTITQSLINTHAQVSTGRHTDIHRNEILERCNNNFIELKNLRNFNSSIT